MSIKEMAMIWNVAERKVHAAAIVVNGGKLPRGRKKWTAEEEARIKELCIESER
jgi:hypothetical protein